MRLDFDIVLAHLISSQSRPLQTILFYMTTPAYLLLHSTNLRWFQKRYHLGHYQNSSCNNFVIHPQYRVFLAIFFSRGVESARRISPLDMQVHVTKTDSCCCVDRQQQVQASICCASTFPTDLLRIHSTPQAKQGSLLTTLPATKKKTL